MIRFVLPINSVVLAGLTELCGLRGVPTIGVSVKNNRIILSAISPEYMKIMLTEITVDCEDISLRVPVSIVKPLLGVGTLAFEVDSNLVLSRIYNNRLLARVRVPRELDYNDDILESVVASVEEHKFDPDTDMTSLMQLKDIAAVNKCGIQVKDGRASIMSDGFVAYGKCNTNMEFIVSYECLISLINFVKSSSNLQMFNFMGYHAVHKNGMVFCWRRSRQFVPDEYNNFLKLKPVISVSADLTSIRSMVRAIPSVRTKVYSSLFSFDGGYLQIQVGNMETFVLTFGQNILLRPDDPNLLKVNVPYQVLRLVLSSSAVQWENVIVNVYPTCVEFKSGDVSVMMVRA